MALLRSKRARSSTGGAVVAVVESRQPVAQRMSRILRAAAGFPHSICVGSPRELASEVGEETRLLVCSSEEAGRLVELADEHCEDAWMLTWTEATDRKLFSLAARHPRIACLLGKPTADNIPRPWELALTVRRLVTCEGTPLAVRDFLQWEGVRSEWFPRSTADLQATLEDVGDSVDRFGVPTRTARRIIGVAHEMLMNAMYDAPVDESGKPLFAHDRTQFISLDPRQTPRFSLGTDGVTLVLQVADPFGGLRRDHVFSSITRGFRSGDRDARREEYIDTGHGGAGLGLHRILSDSSATVFDVVEKHSTVVTATFDLDLSNRDVRSSAKSLLFFSRDRPME